MPLGKWTIRQFFVWLVSLQPHSAHMVAEKIITLRNSILLNHGDHGEHRGKLRARVHSRREWGSAKTKTLQVILGLFTRREHEF
ncbi:MAG: hypothetical protein EBY32_03430 [Proteobacteria bacterium]|nr:hypothetical protein [Pseudomonadota bacterium]